jgi:uncharacterized protein YjbI with pentapeptide repeats
LFAPSGKHPSYFANFAHRINAAGWRPRGSFPNGVILSGVNLSGANLYRMSLNKADLCYANLESAGLAGSNLDGAMLNGANLAEANLAGTSLDAADLIGANLDSANLTGASLVRANLTRCSMEAAKLQRARLDGAILSEAMLNDASLDGASLASANLVGASLIGAKLNRAMLDGADLSANSANVRGCTWYQIEASWIDENTKLPPEFKALKQGKLQRQRETRSTPAEISSLAKPVMICLIGEQPAPNILPIRACKPIEVCLIHTERTERVSKNLAALLKQECSLKTTAISAYNVVKVYEELAAFVGGQNWPAQDLLFNVTGGTKPMSLAAFRLAQELSARVVYLESEGGRSRLDFYGFLPSGEVQYLAGVAANDLLNINDYLSIHGLGAYTQKVGSNDFENAVATTLRTAGLEVLCDVRFTALPALELDLVIRSGNQFGIAELKTGGAAIKKESIDQLNAATAREFLGTYTKRFLIIDREFGTNENNAELARAYNINVIALTEPLYVGGLAPSDQKKLVEAVKKALSR